MDSSQDMSLQQSSPANGTVPLPTSTASSSTYGYGGVNSASTRRTTRASAAHGAHATRQRVESEFESQGENADYEEGTERSFAGSDMVD